MTDSRSLWQSLPAEVQEALSAADKLAAILQKRFPAVGLGDELAEAYDALGFALDQIEGMPHA